MGLAETAELAIRISLTGNARAGVRGLKGDLGGLNQSLGRVGRGVGQIGSGLARAGLLVGGAAITGIAAAAKASIDFEDAFAGVRKTVNEADLTKVGLSFDQLARSFRDMATQIPIAATDFAQIGETAGALGIAAGDIEAFTKTVALLGVTTNLSSDEAAEALGKVGTILHLTGREFEDFADVLVNLGNQGASTEAEIIEVAKRFAAVGRQAGLSKEQILALSSAATSLGAEPEAAGSALSRIFANMTTEIANGTEKGKEFAKITGDSLKELRQRLNKGDALGILQETLKGIAGLSRTEAASVLKALGISNVRDRDAILKMAQNLGFVNDQLAIAEDSAGAMGREAEKRFATVASKLKILKNNAIEAAITFGEGLTPALGRAAEKLTAFLRDPANKNELRELGADVGEAIDKIDWAKVLQGAKDFVGVMKGALDFALKLLSAIQALPKEVQQAGLGFLALNKLSGGLLGAGIGNVVGGLAGAGASGLASRAPGIGKLFAQPVFVTNWPAGGLGGGVGGGGGGLGLAGTVAASAGIAGVGALAANDVPLLAEAFGKGYQAYQQGDTRGLAEALRTVATGTWAIPAPLRDIAGNLLALPPKITQPFDAAAFRLGEKEDLSKQATVNALARVREKAEANRIATVTSKNAIIGAGHNDAASIRGAIARNRPIINVRVPIAVYTNNGVTRRVYSTGSSIGRTSGPTEFDH